jgi:hypothetical protein
MKWFLYFNRVENATIYLLIYIGTRQRQALENTGKRGLEDCIGVKSI